MVWKQRSNKGKKDGRLEKEQNFNQEDYPSSSEGKIQGIEGEKTSVSEKEESFLKIARQDRFSKIFWYLFNVFLIITIVIGLIYAMNPAIIGLVMLIGFPIIAGFFTVILVLLVLLPKYKASKKVDEKVYERWNLFVLLAGFLGGWLLGITNMILGFWVFVWFIVIGNMKAIIQKETWPWNKVPANRPLNVILFSLIWVMPWAAFGYFMLFKGGINTSAIANQDWGNIIDWNALVEALTTNYWGGIVIGYIAAVIMGGTWLIVIASNKETGKRVAIFALFFVYTVSIWGLKAFRPIEVGEQANTIAILGTDLTIVLFTIYNIFKMRGRGTKDFSEATLAYGEEAKLSPITTFFRKRVGDELFNAFMFVFFCSTFFGYFISNAALTVISTMLASGGIPTIDLGELIPNLIQIIIAFVLVIPFLINNVIKLRKQQKVSKNPQNRLLKWKK